jgi:hypothetical protein
MLLDPPRAYQQVADDQQDAGESVERGVDGRQIVDGHDALSQIIVIQMSGR